MATRTEIIRFCDVCGAHGGLAGVKPYSVARNPSSHQPKKRTWDLCVEHAAPVETLLALRPKSLKNTDLDPEQYEEAS